MSLKLKEKFDVIKNDLFLKRLIASIASVCFLILGIPHFLNAQTFQQVPIQQAVGLDWADMKWADLNGDGKLDLVYGGSGNSSTFSILYQKKDSFEVSLTDTMDMNIQVTHQSMDINDFDGDGDLDILAICNQAGQFSGTVRIMENDSGSFRFYKYSDNPDGYLIDYGALMWGDCDNNGTLDLLQIAGGSKISIIKNQKNLYANEILYEENSTPFGMWVDVDNDQDLDVLGVGDGQYWWKNDGFGNFEKVPTGLEGSVGDIQIADFDGDGKLDYLMRKGEYELYRFIDNRFMKIVNVGRGYAAEWGDFNNDGWIDILITGRDGDGCYWNDCPTYLYLNNQKGNFIPKILPEIEGNENGLCAIADYDNDGDLDIATIGNHRFHLYQNTFAEQNAPNQAPQPPAEISQQVSGANVQLSWTQGTDAETPDRSLSYNIYVRKADGTFLINPLAEISSGKRNIVGIGNAMLNQGHQLHCLQDGTYFWGVQTIDAGYRGSTFTEEKSFTIQNQMPESPLQVKAEVISNKRIDLTWEDVATNETAYKIYIYTQDRPMSPIDRPSYILPANTTSFVDSAALESDQTYFYRIVAANCSYPDQAYAEVKATTLPDYYEINYGLYLDGVTGNFASLADVDNDTDLDLLLSAAGKSQIYHWNGKYFETTEQLFPVIRNNSLFRWIDLNQDGYLDMWFIQESLGFEKPLAIYLNDGKGYFMENDSINTIKSLSAINENFVWQDFDQDGDFDIMFSSQDYETGAITEIYEQLENGDFRQLETNPIVGAIKAKEPWADYDNDGDLDLIVIQSTECSKNNWVIYEQTAPKVFTPHILPEIPALNAMYTALNISEGQMIWVDYNSDGWMDIFFAGSSSCDYGSGYNGILENQKNGKFVLKFKNEFAPFREDIQMSWGDLDNDGDVDLYLYGTPDYYFKNTAVYENRGDTVFLETKKLLNSSTGGYMTLGDVESDGDLDLVVLGAEDYSSKKIILYENKVVPFWNRLNTPPTVPANLKMVQKDAIITLSWDACSDSQTAQTGLTYNVYVKDENGKFIVNPYASPQGILQYPHTGNAQKNSFYKLNKFPAGNFTWGVQAIDNGFLGSAFSEPVSFQVEKLEEELPNAIDDSMVNDNILIYPNPTQQGWFYLQLPEHVKTNCFVKISDSRGNQLYQSTILPHRSQQPYKVEWPVGQAGIYFLTIHYSDKIAYKKLIHLP